MYPSMYGSWNRYSVNSTLITSALSVEREVKVGNIGEANGLFKFKSSPLVF